MKDLTALSRSIDEALGALAPDAAADTRAAVIGTLIDAHLVSIVKGIGNAREFGAFLRDVGFAKAAVRKLAPAFKSIAGDADPIGDENTRAALVGMLATIRNVAGTIKRE